MGLFNADPDGMLTVTLEKMLQSVNEYVGLGKRYKLRINHGTNIESNPYCLYTVSVHHGVLIKDQTKALISFFLMILQQVEEFRRK